MTFLNGNFQCRSALNKQTNEQKPCRTLSCVENVLFLAKQCCYCQKYSTEIQQQRQLRAQWKKTLPVADKLLQDCLWSHIITSILLHESLKQTSTYYQQVPCQHFKEAYNNFTQGKKELKSVSMHHIFFSSLYCQFLMFVSVLASFHFDHYIQKHTQMCQNQFVDGV